jgi:hypothetical protein
MNKVLCYILGHHYILSKSIGHIKEYDCVHCGKQVASVDGRKVYPLTPEIRKNNQALEAFYGSIATSSSTSHKTVA